MPSTGNNLLITRLALMHHSNLSYNSYPFEEVTRLWKLLCLNQFHDCLPGSAINLAYVDVHKVSKKM